MSLRKSTCHLTRGFRLHTTVSYMLRLYFFMVPSDATVRVQLNVQWPLACSLMAWKDDILRYSLYLEMM